MGLQVEDIIEEYVPAGRIRDQALRVLHGKGSRELPVPADVAKIGADENFQAPRFRAAGVFRT